MIFLSLYMGKISFLRNVALKFSLPEESGGFKPSILLSKMRKMEVQSAFFSAHSISHSFCNISSRNVSPVTAVQKAGSWQVDLPLKGCERLQFVSLQSLENFIMTDV